MSAFETLTSRLQGVRFVGSDRFTARCPGLSHSKGDRNPSLSGRVLADGRILLHCFAQCDTREILEVIGLTIADLFPERIDHRVAPTKPNHWHARKEAFELMRTDCLLVAIAGENIANGLSLTHEDCARVLQAAVRIRAAVEVCR